MDKKGIIEVSGINFLVLYRARVLVFFVLIFLFSEKVIFAMEKGSFGSTENLKKSGPKEDDKKSSDEKEKKFEHKKLGCVIILNNSGKQLQVRKSSNKDKKTLNIGQVKILKDIAFDSGEVIKIRGASWRGGKSYVFKNSSAIKSFLILVNYSKGGSLRGGEIKATQIDILDQDFKDLCEAVRIAKILQQNFDCDSKCEAKCLLDFDSQDLYNVFNVDKLIEFKDFGEKFLRIYEGGKEISKNVKTSGVGDYFGDFYKAITEKLPKFIEGIAVAIETKKANDIGVKVGFCSQIPECDAGMEMSVLAPKDREKVQLRLECDKFIKKIVQEYVSQGESSCPELVLLQAIKSKNIVFIKQLLKQVKRDFKKQVLEQKEEFSSQSGESKPETFEEKSLEAMKKILAICAWLLAIAEKTDDKFEQEISVLYEKIERKIFPFFLKFTELLELHKAGLEKIDRKNLEHWEHTTENFNKNFDKYAEEKNIFAILYGKKVEFLRQINRELKAAIEKDKLNAKKTGQKEASNSSGDKKKLETTKNGTVEGNKNKEDLQQTKESGPTESCFVHGYGYLQGFQDSI